MMPRDLSEDQLKQIALALKTAREQKAESVADAAFKIALSPAQIRAIEAGELKPFYSSHYFLQAAQRYADLLGVSLPQASPSAADPAQDLAPRSEQADQHQPMALATEQNSSIEAAVITRRPKEMQADQPVQSHTRTKRSLGPWLAGAASLGLAAVITVQIFLKPGEPTAATPQPLASSPQGQTDPSQVTPATTAVTPATAVTQAVVATPAMQPRASNTAAPNTSAPAHATSHLSIASATWVQIVLNSGEKQNLRIEPGQKVGFEPEKTAAIVFGKPEQAELIINGRRVDITPFVLAETPARALVILNKIR